MLEKHPSLIFYFYLANLGAYSPILTTVPSISYAKALIQKKHHSKLFLTQVRGPLHQNQAVSGLVPVLPGARAVVSALREVIIFSAGLVVPALSPRYYRGAVIPPLKAGSRERWFHPHVSSPLRPPDPLHRQAIPPSSPLKSGASPRCLCLDSLRLGGSLPWPPVPPPSPLFFMLYP